MICSYCGAKNSSTREKCFNCGRPLENTKEFNVPISDLNKENIQTYDSDVIPMRVTRKSTSELAKQRTQTTPSPRINDKSSPLQSQKMLNRKEKKPLDKFSIAICILAVLFVCILTITGILVYNNFFKEAKLGSGATAADLGVISPNVEVLTDSFGEQYANITFYGTVGDRIYFSCNESYATFVTGTLEKSFYLKDVYSADKEFLQNTATIDVGAFYVRDSKLYPYNLSPVKVSILPSDFEVAKPTEKNINSYDDFYTIKMWAEPNSKVLINGVDVSQKMDLLGNIKHEIETKANAITTCYIEVLHPYRTPSKESFIITRDTSEIDFKITKVSVSGDVCTITATGEPNAKITSDLPLISAVHNDLYNNYSIKLDLSSYPYGEVDFVLFAQTQNGKTSRSSSIIYWPSEASATQSAKDIVTSPKKGTQYVIANATVTRAIGVNTFEVSTKIDGKTYYFAIKYENNITPVEIGGKYKFFAAGTGTTSKNYLPLLKAWYIYPL